MGFLKNQFSSVIEWNENGEGVLFYKFQNQEIKKGSRLIIRPGQDAIFLYNGRVEGIFQEDGDYDIESDIIPFLTTLKSFKFGFSTPLRAEILFINTKELLVKWGTKNAINLQAPGLPGGMPIRAFGTFNCRVAAHDVVIDKLAGIRQSYTVGDVKERIVASLDQLLMSWISKEGRDMFNLQADARNIAKGIEGELDADMRTLGIAISGFTIESFSYPEEVRKMQEKAAAQAMVGDVNKYTQMAAADSMGKGGGGANMASDMVGLQMGMALGQQMVNQMNMGANAAPQGQPAPQGGQGGQGPKFCPNCGTPTTGSKFCGNCGNQLY
ncbi:MAG: SPFH domain-containing protein [Bacteroidales bacterium]|nr:SPFH domain-containing protein [Bacteroidales bacterium]MCM1416002.1 SPFH domain-containing protein [bacterium]MCM1424277.1 SPFH domain-containing protein [bacterium]